MNLSKKAMILTAGRFLGKALLNVYIIFMVGMAIYAVIIVVQGIYLPGRHRKEFLQNLAKRQKRINAEEAVLAAGRIAYGQKDYMRAEKKARQVLATNDQVINQKAQILLGDALDAEGRSQEAYNAYRQAFDSSTGKVYSSFPNDVAALARYGLLNVQMGQTNAAAQIYAQAVDRLRVC